jgi:Rieske 2Fe-2S family protein
MYDREFIRSHLNERRKGYALPQALYNSPEAFAFDLEAVFGEAWFLAGFTCELPEPKDTLALTIGLSPIVLTRARDGLIRGFYNSCRHRGAQICADGLGRRSRLTCPYHQWVYDLDGKLVHASDMGPDFRASEHGLVPINVEVVAGAIFVSLSKNPTPFEPFRRDLAPALAAHRLDEAKVAFQSTLVEKGNWKLVMENARECYHCQVGHPELSRTFPIKEAVCDGFEKAGNPRHEAFAAKLDRLGLDKGPYIGPWWQVERFPLNEGQVSLTMDGKPAVKKLMTPFDDPDLGSLRWATEPHMFCHSTADTTVMFSAMPTAPNETIVTCKWLVHKDAVEGVDYDLERLAELWTVTNLQDRDLVELNQRGVNSQGYRPGPYSPDRESYVLRFVDWYCDTAKAYLDGKAAPAPKRRSRTARTVVPGTAPAAEPVAARGPDRT